jgi:excisionase family DNA binding protein
VESSEWLTVQQAAAELNVKPVTIRRYVAAGRLAARRLGRQIRIRRSDVESLLGWSGVSGEAATHSVAEAAVAYRPVAERSQQPLSSWEVTTMETTIVRSGTRRFAIRGAADLETMPVMTGDDPLVTFAGAAASGASDVSSNKHAYLAEAYADLHDR